MEAGHQRVKQQAWRQPRVARGVCGDCRDRDVVHPLFAVCCDTLADVRAAGSGIARNFLAAGLIIAGIGAGALAIAQEEALYTFGTTVVIPGGLIGVIYYIRPLSKFLPDFQWLDPIGVIYTSTLNVTPRSFREGFPGVTDRYEWFAIDYSGRFWIEKPGPYRFELTSDDGSKLYIDGGLVVNNDGVHGPETRLAASTLERGIHRIRVSYFQGPRDEVALVLRVAGPGEEWRVFSTDEFKPPSDPATWGYLGNQARLQVSSVSGAPGEKVGLEISLDSPAGSAPVALQWETIFPAQILEDGGNGPEPGRAASDSGKSLTCTLRKTYSYLCILVGGQKPVANGPIATLRFKIRPEARAGTTVVRVERAEAVTADLKKLTVKDAEGTVTIH
jgi:hypothetical protein